MPGLSRAAVGVRTGGTPVGERVEDGDAAGDEADDVAKPEPGGSGSLESVRPVRP